MKRILILALVLGILLAGCTGSGTITMEKYSQLKNGMSYENVSQILGSKGEMLSSGDLLGSEITTYVWKNPDGGNLTVVFSNKTGLFMKGAQNLK